MNRNFEPLSMEMEEGNVDTINKNEEITDE